MPERLDVARQVQAMLGRGWRWSEADPDVLLHPQDHNFFVRYDRAAGKLGVSAALDAALRLVIPTAASKSKSFWRKPSN